MHERIFINYGFGEIKKYPNIYKYIIDRNIEFECKNIWDFCKEIEILLENCNREYKEDVRQVFINACFCKISKFSGKKIISASLYK